MGLRTENEIKNQIAICDTIKENIDDWDLEDKWALWGYIHALKFVVGILKAKFNKDDI